jgi:hypothetical protein
MAYILSVWENDVGLIQSSLKIGRLYKVKNIEIRSRGVGIGGTLVKNGDIVLLVDINRETSLKIGGDVRGVPHRFLYENELISETFCMYDTHFLFEEVETDSMS